MYGNDPEYLSASPTVMAYDYATGDYFAPAVYGQQTAQQAQAAAVKAVGPTGMEIAQPAPLVAHPTPSYPKVGHTPQFTMPMNKGEWNIKGVNMPTYSPALPPMPGSDWRTFPQPIDGRQLTWQRPQFSAFAGMGAIDYAKAKATQYRDVQGTGGYVYRQFNDGVIQILASPSRKLPVGTMLKGVAEDPNYRRWLAITGEIGSWKTYRRESTAEALRAITDTALTVASAFPSKRRKGAKAAGGAGAAAAPMPADLPAEAETPPATGGFLSGPVPWILGGSVLVLTIALLASRSSK